MADKCGRCGVGDAEELHLCPFDVEINHDILDECEECDCCDNCQQECAWDV